MFGILDRLFIKAKLPVQPRGAGDLTWRLKSQSDLAWVSEVAKALASSSPARQPENARIYKWDHRRWVFSVAVPGLTTGAVLVKVFHLPKWEQGIKHHKYALNEAANLVRASERGILVPALFGYGVRKTRMGLPKAGTIVMEELSSVTPIGELMENSHNESARAALLMRTIPVLLSLYRAGCNHIDVNSKSILMGSAEGDRNAYIIDFQHAIFHPAPRLRVVMFEAGYLAGRCRKWLPDSALFAFGDALLDALSITDTSERTHWISQFKVFMNGELSRKERSQIR